MRRKVIRQGHNTLTVTLPSVWVRQHKLAAGDEITVEATDGHILITPGHAESRSTADIRVMKPDRLVTRSIFNQYRKGTDEITVRYDDPIIIKDIYGCIPLLMGFEITAEGKNHAELRNMLTIDEEDFTAPMNRYLVVTTCLAEETYRALAEKRYADLEGIMELEKVQNRLYLFLSRLVNKRCGFPNATLHYLFIQRCEDIADDYKHLCRYVLELKGDTTVSPAVLSMLRDINETLRELVGFYHKFDVGIGGDIILRKKRILQRGFSLFTAVSRKELRVVHILCGLIVKIYEASSPVFGMADEPDRPRQEHRRL